MNTLLASLVLLTGSVTPIGDEFDFAALVAEVLARAELADSEPGPETVIAVFESGAFHRAPLGLLDVVFPVEVADDKSDAEDVAELTAELCRLQAHWLAWSARDESEARETTEHLNVLGKWASGWTGRKLARASREPGTTLFERLEADEDVLGARDGLQRTLDARREAVGRAETYARARLVLTPTRRQFIEVAAFLGWAETERRPVLWDESTLYVRACWGSSTQVVPLQHAAWPFGVGTAFRGAPISNSKTGLRQHVLDRAAASLLMLEFFYESPPLIETALSTNLVIETCGENDVTNGVTSSLWTRQGGSTQAYSRFVPGGNSSGGTLPKRVASAGARTDFGDSPSAWRKTAGKDWFAKPLRAGQKAGAKLAGKQKDLADELRDDKRLHFALETNTGAGGHFVSAPFLGAAAADKPIPPLEVLDDYEEFFRAYRSCFLHWLRTVGPPETKNPETLFATWLGHLLAGRDATPESASANVYGLPLGSDEGPSLENQFLDWLSRQR